MKIGNFIGRCRRLRGIARQNIALVIDNDKMFEKGVKEYMFAIIEIKKSKTKTR